MMFTPIAIILATTSVLDLSHLSVVIFLALVGKGLCDNVLADYLWARACLLTSPTVRTIAVTLAPPQSNCPLSTQVATVGLSLTIPLAAVSDFVLHGKRITIAAAMGGVMVLTGFALVNVIVTAIIKRKQSIDSERTAILIREEDRGAHR